MAHTTSSALLASAYNQLPDDQGTWVIKDLLPVGGSLSLYGSPKAGKSHFTLQLAHSIVGSDDDFLTFPIHRHGRVLYLQLDTPRSLWKRRTQDYEALGLDQRDLYIADREMAPFPFEILRPDMGASWLREQCQEIVPSVVIVDVLRNMTMADEDKSGDMRRAFDALRSAVEPAAVILMSHAKKANLSLPADERDNVIQDNRGSSFLPGAVDGIVKLTNKQMICQSRTMEERRVGLTFSPRTLWTLTNPPQDDVMEIVDAVLADPEVPSQRAAARIIAEQTEMTEQAARRLLQRRGHGSTSHSSRPQ